MLQELSNHLANATALTLGTTLQVGFFERDAPEECAMVKDAGGVPSPVSKDRRVHRFQIMGRSTSHLGARAICYLLHDILNVKGGITLDTFTGSDEWVIDTVVVALLPTPLGRDEKGRHRFIANFHLYAYQV